MIENPLRLWWKSLWSPDVRSAKHAVAQRFREAHEEFRLLSVDLVRCSESKLVFLAYYQRQLPTRPAPFFAYEYLTENQVVTQLPESVGEIYRPKAYK
jgi:hypothetical protein